MFGKHHSVSSRRKMGESHRGKPLHYTEDGLIRRELLLQECRKPVICVETGKRFKSQSEAAKQYKVSSANICMACKLFPYRTSGGVHWTYENNERITQNIETLPLNPTRRKPVLCVETGITYASIGEAAKKTGQDQRHISRCCKGVRKTLHGQHWRFVNEQDE